MRIIKETKDKETWEYRSAIERNEHVNSYGLYHIITKITGDGEKKPLTATFLKERRNFVQEKHN